MMNSQKWAFGPIFPQNEPLEQYLKVMTNKKRLHFKNVWFRLKLDNLIIKSAETA